MKKSVGVPNITTISEEQKKAQPRPRVSNKTEELTPSFSSQAPSDVNRPKPPAMMPRQARAVSGKGQVQKTSIEERVKRIQAQRAKEKAPSSFNDIVNSLAVQLRAFATTLIKGKPNVSKTTKDFPINRNIIGRMKRYGPAKVYRLKGYTTIGRVKKKRGRDMLKKHRNRLIFLSILGIFILVMYVVIDPLPTIKQFLFDIGY